LRESDEKVEDGREVHCGDVDVKTALGRKQKDKGSWYAGTANRTAYTTKQTSTPALLLDTQDMDLFTCLHDVVSSRGCPLALPTPGVTSCASAKLRDGAAATDVRCGMWFGHLHVCMRAPGLVAQSTSAVARGAALQAEDAYPFGDNIIS